MDTTCSARHHPHHHRNWIQRAQRHNHVDWCGSRSTIGMIHLLWQVKVAIFHRHFSSLSHRSFNPEILSDSSVPTLWIETEPWEVSSLFQEFPLQVRFLAYKEDLGTGICFRTEGGERGREHTSTDKWVPFPSRIPSAQCNFLGFARSLLLIFTTTSICYCSPALSSPARGDCLGALHLLILVPDSAVVAVCQLSLPRVLTSPIPCRWVLPITPLFWEANSSPPSVKTRVFLGWSEISGPIKWSLAGSFYLLCLLIF